jgi:hypothetical protein
MIFACTYYFIRFSKVSVLIALVFGGVGRFSCGVQLMNEKSTAQVKLILQFNQCFISNDMEDSMWSHSTSLKKQEQEKRQKSNDLRFGSSTKIWKPAGTTGCVLKATNWEFVRKFPRGQQSSRRYVRNATVCTLVEMIPYGIMEFDVKG